MATNDQIFDEEQAHLHDIYQQIVEIRDELEENLKTKHAQAAQDLRDMSEEVKVNFSSWDETMETLAAIETLNSVIDVYNQVHDFDVERLRRTLVLLNQPYFAKVRLKMRPNRPARDIYIGTVGLTDKDSNPLIVDWRSPVAETYYNQETGPTSYLVDGKPRHVELELRRQFDIVANKLNSYFDTTVAIQDSLLLSTLKKQHTEKLKAITATIQREQNEVVRHKDVGALLVNGIAGSGKTSVLLQRIAYLFYTQRENLSPDQIYLFTPNDVFSRYINNVLPSLGEANPQTFTWRAFVASRGLKDRSDGADGAVERLDTLERTLASTTLEDDDFQEIRMGDRVLLKASQVASAARKFANFPPGPRFCALTKDELHTRLERKLSTLANNEDVQEEMLALDVDEQIRIFGELINPNTEEETKALARTFVEDRYGAAHDTIDRTDWLRIDRIGARMLDGKTLSAAEWLYLKILIARDEAKDARYVMIDEVQDYTSTQLKVLARYFAHAHFLLLGDANQTIMEGRASFSEIRAIFKQTHHEVDTVALPTSYRSTPEITQLFMSMVDPDDAVHATSVQESGKLPRIIEAPTREKYLAALAEICASAQKADQLTALIAQDGGRAHWLGRQLGIDVLHQSDSLPEKGVVLMDLALAKGLEFDAVVVVDAQAEVFADTPLARRRLYTAISRAMHEVTLVSQGPLSPLLASYAAAHDAAGDATTHDAAGASGDATHNNARKEAE
ncbi:MAG: HelD family protein [Atopobiaceae bacterium]|jgi:DNA helicase-2/ATP-dependent DNA helicase PcrA